MNFIMIGLLLREALDRLRVHLNMYLVNTIITIVVTMVVQGYCAKHSKKLGADGTPRKVTSSTPKKHSEMTEDEKKAAKARK